MPVGREGMAAAQEVELILPRYAGAGGELQVGYKPVEFVLRDTLFQQGSTS